MHRRTYLRVATTVGATSIAGCIGFGDATPNVALPEPDRQFESEDVPYPAWGERLPDVTVPAPLERRAVPLRTIDAPHLLTFFYSHCQTVCPVVIAAMRNVQTHALENDYDDQVAFFPTTFDPQRDDADRLREYAETMHIDADAGNWHFLRPRTKERAKAVVSGAFGVAFQRTRPEDMDQYMFTHSPLTLLANADSYVERAYNTGSPNPERIIADLETVRHA